MKLHRTVWTLAVGAVLGTTGCTGFNPGIKSHNLPPAQQLMEPGPGVGGPGPGVLPPVMPASAVAFGPLGGLGGVDGTYAEKVQINFNQPHGMQVRWDVSAVGTFDSEPLVVPGLEDFPQGGIYRLKLTNIPDHEGVELYPTLEVGPVTPRTAAYLAHSALPIQFTQEDFDQVLSGNFVTKVIYLPDPEFQEMALAGVETLVSTRLDPGVDPIVEADRRGSIMGVVRLGNKDIERAGAMAANVLPASYDPAMGGMVPTPMSVSPLSPAGMIPAYVSGITVPQYGMPYVGTPIGLPGPPHIPLGAPAGFQRHVMNNRTHVHIPGPTEQVHVRLRQTPGYSYPKPPSHIWIREQNIHPSLPYTQPHHDHLRVVH